LTGLKNYTLFIVSLLIAIIVLRFFLKNGKKLPVVGKVFDKAEDLSGLE
jgi:hypothetical protein